MVKMLIVSLDATAPQLGEGGETISALSQEPDTLAVIAHGREYRSN